MAYSFEKNTGDIVISGWERGIAASPHLGIANLKNANIATENGEVMCNFTRTQQSTATHTGTIAFFGTVGGKITFEIDGLPSFLYVNQAITIGSGITGLSAGTYWVLSVSGPVGAQLLTLTGLYNSSIANSGASAGSATYTFASISSTPVANATEQYFDGTHLQYRYYVAEKSGYVWVLDTGLDANHWVLIDSILPGGVVSQNLTGMGVMNGHLHVFTTGAHAGSFYKLTALLGQSPVSPGGAGWQITGMSTSLNSPVGGFAVPHFCLVGHAASLSYTDGSFVATIIPDASTASTVANVFSYGSYTASTFTLTLSTLIAGSFPVAGETITFYSDTTFYTGVTDEIVYYVCSGSETNAVAPNPTTGVFSIKATASGTSAISLSAGSGTQYFNTYSPFNGTVNGTVVGGSGSTFVGAPQACTLPQTEIATALAELGTNLIIGTMGNTLYQWDEGIGGSNDISPQGFVPMAENNCTFLLTVNNAVYVFMGQKGNIYVTQGSVATGVLSVPDYMAGLAASPTSYIEPFFTFGSAFFERGRVFFSIQDQTAGKSGNCGGVYSFVPSFFNAITGQDTGTSLRLENQNSYGTYNGLSTALFPSQDQNVVGVQYFSGWVSDKFTSPSYGIDASGTTPYTGGQTIIETDIIPTGTYLHKKTFRQIEYKLAAPLAPGESVEIKYRTDATSSFVSLGTLNTETTQSLSGYYPVNFDVTQWLQLQVTLTSTATNPSFVRLIELRVR